MEVPSTGALLDKINTINNQELEFETVNLEEIDDAMEKQEEEAQLRYDNFDTDQMKVGLDDGMVVLEKEIPDTPGGVKVKEPTVGGVHDEVQDQDGDKSRDKIREEEVKAG